MPAEAAENQTVVTRFPLLRNFVLTGLIAIIVLVSGLGVFIHRAMIDNLSQVGENKNIALARMLSNDVWRPYVKVLENSKHHPAHILKELPAYKHLLSDVNRHIDSVSIIKVVIYDAGGRVLFSTDLAQLGETKTDSPIIQGALAGKVVSKLVFLDRVYANQKLLRHRNVLSSYIPLQHRPNVQGSVTSGVIEIYSDMSMLYKQAVNTRDKMLLMLAMAMLFFFAMLFVFVRRADLISNTHLRNKQQEQDHIHHIAYHDSLTGLPNRDMFRQRLQAAMARAERNDQLLAVMFLDLDRFKNINDSLGHNTGDQLLKEIAKRLLSCMRLTDTVARQGGDEFTIVLDGITHVDEVEEVAKRILSSLREPFNISGHEFSSSISIGITIYPLDERDIDLVLKNADKAMYAAKESGRNRYMFYTADMSLNDGVKLDMEHRLRVALEENEYLLQYQPIINLRTGKMMGVEALLRWQNEEYGIVSPLKFIPILEESGYINMVGAWVLKTACHKAVEWQRMGFEPILMSVNVSIIQYRSLKFIDSVKAALQESGLDPKYLKLEITESVLMDQSDASVKKMESIRALGVSIAADDFGTGYSSLSYLKKLPIDTLKIDRSFVMDVHKSSDSAAIVTAIVSLAHSLRLNIIAEGVEQLEELNFLSALSCSYIQGYFFSKPLTERALLEVLSDPDFFLDKLDAAREQNQLASA